MNQAEAVTYFFGGDRIKERFWRCGRPPILAEWHFDPAPDFSFGEAAFEASGQFGHLRFLEMACRSQHPDHFVEPAGGVLLFFLEKAVGLAGLLLAADGVCHDRPYVLKQV